MVSAFCARRNSANLDLRASGSLHLSRGVKTQLRPVDPKAPAVEKREVRIYLAQHLLIVSTYLSTWRGSNVLTEGWRDHGVGLCS